MNLNFFQFDDQLNKVFENPLILTNVTKWLNLFDVQRLRKVSRGIRNCVDILMPDPNLKSIMIRGTDLNRLELLIETNEVKVPIEYSKQTEGCTVRARQVRFDKGWNPQHFVKWQWPNEKHLETQDFLAAFTSDLSLVLRNQESCTDEICMEFSSESEGFESYVKSLIDPLRSRLPLELHKVLSTRKPLLKVRTLKMQVRSEDDVMKILPYLDPNSLKVIELSCCSELNDCMFSINEKIRVDEISKLNQWKCAEILNLKQLNITTPLRDFNVFHFTDIEICLNTISTDDVIYLRENLRQSPKLKHFHINFNENQLDGLYQALGQPSYQLDCFETHWFYRLSDPEFVLSLKIYSIRAIVFERCEKSSLEQKNIILLE